MVLILRPNIWTQAHLNFRVLLKWKLNRKRVLGRKEKRLGFIFFFLPLTPLKHPLKRLMGIFRFLNLFEVIIGIFTVILVSLFLLPY